MRMLLNIWTFICRLGMWLHMRLDLYRIKSNLYRAIFERQYRDYPLTTYSTFGELAAFLRTLIWTADSWTQLWDAISYAGKVEAIGYRGDRRVGDCDEFAIYAAEAIRLSVQAGKFHVRAETKMLTVTWLEGAVPGGHNVCFLELPDEPAHRRYAYMDYGMPIYFASPVAVVRGVLQRYTANGVCIGWTLSDSATLRMLEHHWDV
jgi:hypothetical protein